MGGCFSGPQGDPPAANGPQAQDTVSQGLADAQQAVGLIDGIYKIVEPHILAAMKRRDETKYLKKFIGPWWEQAFEHGACMVPVLDVKDFEKHLQHKNARLQPQRNCTASSPWGRLLHALAIDPDDLVVTWKPASGARWEMPKGELAMDVRGAAFCHLVNLYKIEDPSDEGFLVEGKRQEKGRCRLSFGWLTWTSDDAGHMLATFEPDTIPKLNGPKLPFGRIDTTPLQQGHAELWKSYEAAFKDGISDEELVWPDPSKALLPERLERLVASLRKLEHSSAKLILTRTWLDQASSIRRRATTDGGNDKTFLQDAYMTLAQHPKRPLLMDYECSDIQAELESCFFFKKDEFSIQRPRPPHSMPFRQISYRQILHDTLESYSAQPSTSWKGRLYTSRDHVYTVMTWDRVLEVRPDRVQILDFAPGDPLWSALTCSFACMFLVNISVTVSVQSLKHLFTTQLEGGRIETVHFAEDAPGKPA
ncbi:hypothetical protein H2202_009955 [Exophiala xenobiotica]|nr:hypothetical protein H2202_009955 [Exophiala xenobiotica]